MMKRVLIVLTLVGMTICDVAAQSYGSSQTERLGYGYKTFPSKYYGFRIGIDYTHISSKDPDHGCGRRTRLNVGLIYGKGLSKSTPIYIETGLSYVGKGGGNKEKEYEGEMQRKKDFNLDYLEIPLVLKYMYTTGSGFAAHIFFGGFFSCGIGGKIKEYPMGDENPNEYYKKYSSFSDREDAFSRFDAGLRFGLGVSYEIFYVEFAYDLGLANINHGKMQGAHNRGAIFNIGVNF